MEHQRSSERARGDQLPQRKGSGGTGEICPSNRSRLSMMVDGMAYAFGVLIMCFLWSMVSIAILSVVWSPGRVTSNKSVTQEYMESLPQSRQDFIDQLGASVADE